MKMKIAELSTTLLDYAVAKALKKEREWLKDFANGYSNSPSTDGRAAQDIIENCIHTIILRDGDWQAEAFNERRTFCYCNRGVTFLQACMRVYVTSRLNSSEVDIPTDLYRKVSSENSN